MFNHLILLSSHSLSDFVSILYFDFEDIPENNELYDKFSILRSFYYLFLVPINKWFRIRDILKSKVREPDENSGQYLSKSDQRLKNAKHY